MAKSVEVIEFNHPNFNNRYVKVTVEKQGETVTHMECNVPELGNLNRGNMQKTYQNLVEFVAKINGNK